MKKNLFLFTTMFSVLLFGRIVYSQSNWSQQVITNIYPKNHSKYVNPESVLIFHLSPFFNRQEIQDLSFRITGTKRGFITSTQKITHDGKTLIVKPEKPFLPGETVTTEVVSKDFSDSPLLLFSFKVSPVSHPLLSNKEMLNQSLQNFTHFKQREENSQRTLQTDPNLPDDFPQYYVSEKNNPGTGHYFLDALSRDSTKPEYNLIIDTTGFPVYYQHFQPNHRKAFFTYHPQVELLTYYDESLYKFIALNNNLEQVGSYSAVGYFTDLHELVLNEDGSYWLFGYDTQPVDVSQIYPGGCESALVTGTIIQKIDADSNLVFEWSSWDHFSILDADTGFIDLTSCQFDYCHGNALSFDSLGNILLSSRNMSEITKINAQTGDIIWRMGGYHNQFTFINDTIPFKAQHNIKYLGNQFYSMFDNGNSRIPPFTRAITYQLDEVNMTATLTEDFQQSNPPDFTPFMGSNQQLENGSHLIGWAFNLQKYSLTQFDVNGNIEFEIKPVDTFSLVSYRAAKYNWETSLFNFAVDTLDFGNNVLIGDSVCLSVCLINNSDNPLEINGYYSTDSTISLASPLPVTLNANSCDSISVCFKPAGAVPVSAVLSVYHQTDSIRIACQTRVLGGGIVDNIFTHSHATNHLTIAPNPCTTRCSVAFSNGSVITGVKVFNVDGKLVRHINVNQETVVNLSKLKKGVYLIKLFGKKSYCSGKLIVQ